MAVVEGQDRKRGEQRGDPRKGPQSVARWLVAFSVGDEAGKSAVVSGEDLVLNLTLLHDMYASAAGKTASSLSAAGAVTPFTGGSRGGQEGRKVRTLFHRLATTSLEGVVLVLAALDDPQYVLQELFPL